jgi:hypothetical protein
MNLVKGFFFHPVLVAKIWWAIARGKWLDVQLWLVQRRNARLRARIAALQAEIAIRKAAR